MSGRCRTDRPYIPRLKPAREAHPPKERHDSVRVAGSMPGKDSKSLSGGQGVKPPALRSEATQAPLLVETRISDSWGVWNYISYRVRWRVSLCPGNCSKAIRIS